MVDPTIGTKSSSATANDVLPWNTPTPTGTAENAKVLSTTNYLDTTKVPLTAGATTDSKLEQDNQKLFSIYNAVNTLSQLAVMAQSSTATAGQLAGLNTRFQTGLSQIQQYLGKISGPLLDRIDIHVEVPAVPYKELRGASQSESSLAGADAPK